MWTWFWVCLICGKSTEHPGLNKTISLLSVWGLAYCTPGKESTFWTTLGPGWKRILIWSCCCSVNSTLPGAGTQGSDLLKCQHVPGTSKQFRETPRSKSGFSMSQSLLPADNLGGASQFWQLRGLVQWMWTGCQPEINRYHIEFTLKNI